MTLPYTAGVPDRGRSSTCSAPSSYREDCYARPLAFYADESIGVRLHNLTPEVSIVAMPYGRYVENDESLHATDLLLAARRRHDDPAAREDRGRLRQLGVRQDRRAARRLRRSHRPQPGRARLRGLGRQLLPRQERDGDHAARHRQRARRHHAAHVMELLRDDARDSGRRALDRPHRDHARRRGRSSAAPASRSPPSRASTTARSARAAWAPSCPSLRDALLRRRARESARSTGTGAIRSTPTRRAAAERARRAARTAAA